MRITKLKSVLLLLIAIVMVGFFSACLTSKESTESAGPAIVSVPQGDMYAGGLVWNNWTTPLAGGTGNLPEGVTNKDFLRCKACHGWDVRGANGGYVRRTGFPEKTSRPRPTEGTDLSTKLGSVTIEMASHQSGRTWAEENNDAPNFTLDGGMTDQQLADAVSFLNNGPKIGDIAEIDISRKPVRYTFVNANIEKGKDLYVASCQACHGADGGQLEDINLVEYLQSDGKYSEAFHKMIYGAGAGMTRQISGSLDAEKARDILAWAQSVIE